MRRLVLGLGALGLVLAAWTSTRAAAPIVRDHRGERPDLTVYKITPNGKDVVVGVKNIGKQPVGKAFKVKVQAYHTVKGKLQLVGTYFATAKPFNKFQWVRVHTNTDVRHRFLVVYVDALNEIAESNENNNRGKRAATFP